MPGFLAACASRLAGLLAMLLPLLFLHLHSANSALSVMPQHSDGIVMQLRSAIMLDEKDLAGPSPPTTCSSLDDGPYCDTLRLKSLSTEGRSSDMILSAGDMHDTAQFVVDGVLSRRLQMRNKGAFDWSMETYRSFNTHVSRVVTDALSGNTADKSSRLESPRSAAKHTQSGAQCFRLAFDRLLPFSRAGGSGAAVPQNFSAGLPRDMAASWEGVWESEASLNPFPTGHAQHVPWATHLRLRTALGYLRFKQPVILSRLIIALPDPLPTEYVAGGSVRHWGEGGLICGRHKKTQKWCVALDHIAANAVAATNGAATQDAPYLSNGLFYTDIGNSIHAVDELAFIAAPPDELRLAMVEVVATQPSHPLFSKAPAQQRVVLLRRAGAGTGTTAGSGQSGASVAGGSIGLEPVLTMVSRDAVLWDLNEVLRHHMLLKPAAGPQAATQKTRRQAMRSFQDMLKELKAGRLRPPPGVSLARLKKEVVMLVESTKEIQDDDVLLHSKIDSLLQQRLQDNVLDGLLTLQAYWQRSHGGSAADGPTETVRADDAPDGRTSTEEQQSADGADIIDVRAGRGEVEHGTDIAQSMESKEALWSDEADEAMQHASEELEKKSAAMREKRKKQGMVNMDLQHGNIQIKVVQSPEMMQQLQSQFESGSGTIPEFQMGGDGVATEVPQELMQKIQQIVTKAMGQASGGSDDVSVMQVADEPEEGPEAGKIPEAVMQNLKSIQDAFAGQFSQGEGGIGVNPEKVEFRMLTVDENGQLSPMMNAQNAEEGGQPGMATVEASGEIPEILRSMLSNVVRQAADSDEDSGDDSGEESVVQL